MAANGDHMVGPQAGTILWASTAISTAPTHLFEQAVVLV